MEDLKLVLLVEDHMLLRQALSEMIGKIKSKYKYYIHEAATAEEAIAMAIENNYVLILMDFYLPGTTGAEATKEIIKHKKGAKILGLSIDNDVDNITAMKEAGAKGFITKNINRDELVYCMESVIDGGENCYSDNVKAELKNYADKLKRHLLIEGTQQYLTKRQIEVAKLKINFDSNQEIAKKMGIAPRTVETHLNLMSNKFNTQHSDRLLLLKRAKDYLIKMGILKK